MTAHPWRQRAFNPEAYWRQPSVVCDDCQREFSAFVGHLHAERTGHTVGPVAAWLLEQTRERQEEVEAMQQAIRARQAA